MMNSIIQAQAWVMVTIGVIMLAVEVYALFEAARGISRQYVAHGKLTKPIWVGITAVAVMLGFIGLFNPLSFPGMLAVAACGVFLADVRPVVSPSGRKNDGPYGPW